MPALRHSGRLALLLPFSGHSAPALPSRAAHGADLAGMAAACGFPVTGTLHEKSDADAALPAIRTSPGPALYVAKVRAEPLPFALPAKDGAYLKDRFRRALLGISFL